MTKLPSRFQIGDKTKIQSIQDKKMVDCTILAVIFTIDKVYYDVDVNGSVWRRIDSSFLEE